MRLLSNSYTNIIISLTFIWDTAENFLVPIQTSTIIFHKDHVIV